MYISRGQADTMTETLKRTTYDISYEENTKTHAREEAPTFNTPEDLHLYFSNTRYGQDSLRGRELKIDLELATPHLS